MNLNSFLMTVMKENVMNDGVELILARMETHPEEFYTYSDKWKFIERFKDYMSETEKGMVSDKLKEIRRQELTSRVMSTFTDNMKISTHMKQAFDIAPLVGEGQPVLYDR
jgi:hypothetical protein